MYLFYNQYNIRQDQVDLDKKYEAFLANRSVAYEDRKSFDLTQWFLDNGYSG